MATILLFYFSFLAMQPLVPLVRKASTHTEQCTMACCQKHKQPVKKQMPNGNCCNKEMCNPFALYSCCLGFIVTDKHNAPIGSSPKNALVVPMNNILVPNFCANCWHPPEYSLA